MASSNQVFYWANKEAVDGSPIRDITGNISLEGRRIFVIRAKTQNGLIPGNYEDGMDQAEFEQAGPKQSSQWEYLISNENAYGMGLWI